MATAFISYAVKDRDFAKRLAELLAHRGHKVWGDWKDLPPARPWRDEIAAGIESADAFVVVLTPDWAASELGKAELELATAHSKRVIPILRRNLDSAHVDTAIRDLHWIELDERSDWDAGVRALFQAVEEDSDWVTEHTRLLQRAEEWRRHGEDSAYLLRGKALARAEIWLARGNARRSPAVTNLHALFIVQSRRRRRRLIRRNTTRRGVFVSYRRSDAAASAGRLADALSAVVRRDSIFIDVARVDPGADFMTSLEQALDDTIVLLVVIGSRWLDERGPDGRARLDDPGDVVRLEIATALARGIAVIPVLVEGAVMPTRDELPPALHELARRQAIVVNHESWHRDVKQLIASMPADAVRPQRRFPGFTRSS
jgi:hypothetical protein